MESSFEPDDLIPPPTDDAGYNHRPHRLRTIMVGAFGVLAFFFFLIVKLPEARIQNLVIAHIRIAAQDQGFTFNAEKVKTSLIFGPALKFYNVELRSLEDDKQALRIPFLKVRPKVLSLLTSTKKAGITAEMMEGEISGTVGMALTNGVSSALLADLDIDNIDLGKAGILKKFLQIDLTSGKINGSIDVSLDFQQPQKSDGKVKLSIDKLASPAQSVYGFNLPKLNISQSKIDLGIDKGVIQIKTFDVGKDTATDDVVARISGTGALDRSLERTRVDARATFRFSQSVVQSFPLLDALLGPAKTADGSYAYKLSGSLMGLEAHPGQ